MKKVLSALALVLLTAVLFAACGGGPKASGPNQVGMDTMSFLKERVIIKKGEKVTLVNESSAVHVASNGTWDNGTQKPKKESGAPTVDDVQIPAGSSVDIGPFTNAGTFLIYCPLHVDMKLTVVVK